MSEQTISYDNFVEIYKPLKNPINHDACYEGRMLETYGEEFEIVKKANALCVWTLLEVDGESYIASGLHFVNRLGYFIAEIPCEVNDNIEVSLSVKKETLLSTAMRQTHENYDHIKQILPQLYKLAEKETALLPMPIMDCKITVKQKGVSIMRLEIAFCEKQKDEPDHKMQVKLNLSEHTAEPESVWFKCRGSTKVHAPKIGADPAILKVQNNTLKRWLEPLVVAYPASLVS